MDVMKLCGIAIASLLLILLVRQTKNEFATLLTMFTCVTLSIVAIANFYPTLHYLKETLSNSTFSPYVAVLLKALAIGFTTQTTADICKDAGESAIADKVELIGKAEILLISLPLLKKMVELATEILCS